MKSTVIVTLGTVVIVVIAILIYPILFHTIPPNFSVEPRSGPGGTWSLQIESNFVVRRIYGITVSDASGELVSRKGSFRGQQVVPVPSHVPAGATLDVECELQYDRIFPAITTVTKSVVLR